MNRLFHRTFASAPRRVGQVFLHPRGKNEFQLSLLDKASTNPAIPLGSSTSAEPNVDTVIQNSQFVPLLHRILQPIVHLDPDTQHTASAIGSGYIHVVDQRAEVIYGRIPEVEDIIMSVRAEDGKLLENSAEGSPSYRVWTNNGGIQLSEFLHGKVIEALRKIDRS